jgi:hypothetical protein
MDDDATEVGRAAEAWSKRPKLLPTSPTDLEPRRHVGSEGEEAQTPGTRRASERPRSLVPDAPLGLGEENSLLEEGVLAAVLKDSLLPSPPLDLAARRASIADDAELLGAGRLALGAEEPKKSQTKVSMGVAFPSELKTPESWTMVSPTMMSSVALPSELSPESWTMVQPTMSVAFASE